MPDYNYNGTLLTEQDINDFAKEDNLTPEEYIEKWDIKLEEPEAPETPDFQTPPEITPAPVEVTEQAGMDLPSVDTSLGSPKKIDPKKYTEADSSQKVEMLKKEYGNMFKIQDLENGLVRFTNSDGLEQEFNLNESSQYESNIGLGGSMLKTTPATNIEDIQSWAESNQTDDQASEVFTTYGVTKDNYWEYTTQEPGPRDFGFVTTTKKIEDPAVQNELLIDADQAIYQSIKDPSFLDKNISIADIGATSFSGWSEDEIEKNKQKVFDSFSKEYEEKTGNKLTRQGFDKFYDDRVEGIFNQVQKNLNVAAKVLALNTELNPEFAESKNNEYLSQYSSDEQIQIELVQERTSLINKIKEVKNQISLVSGAEETASLNKNLQKLESDLQITNDKIDSFKSPVKTYTITMGAGGPMSKPSEKFVGDPAIGTTYEEQITSIAEKNVESFAEVNPLANYDSAKEAYNNQIVQLQLIEKQAQDSNITLNVPYTIAKNLKKLGVSVDKDNKVTTDYRTLRQAGLKPEDIKSSIIADYRDQYESSDFVKYRMYLEEYNEQNDLGKALYMYSIAEIDPTKTEKQDNLLDRVFQGAADYFGITRDLSDSDKRNIALFINDYYPGTFTKEEVESLKPTMAEEIATEAVPGLVGVGEIIASLTVGNRALAATKIYKSISTLAKEGSTIAKIGKGALELAVEEGTLTVMTGNVGDGTAFYTTKKLAQAMGPGRRFGMFSGLYNFGISGTQGATALFSAEIAREIEILEPHLLEQIDKIIDDKDLDRKFIKDLITFQLYGAASLKTSDFTGRRGVLQNYYKLKTKATDAFDNAQELQGDVKEQGVLIQRGNQYKVVSKLDAAKYNKYYELELIAQQKNNYINNSFDLRAEGTEQKLNETLITTYNKELKRQFGDDAITTSLKFDDNLQGEKARFNDRTGEILVDPKKASLSEIYHELDHARSNEMLKNDPKTYREYVNGLMFELKNLEIGIDENGKPVTGSKLESLIKNDPQYSNQIRKNPDVFYREYMAFLMQYATKPEFYASKTGLVKEVKDYFKMWYGDKSHTPTTAQQWIDKLSLFGAKERYNLGSGNTYKRLAYINLEEVEALEQEFGENTPKYIETLSSRDFTEKDTEQDIKNKVSKKQKEAEDFFIEYQEKLEDGGTINKDDFHEVVFGMAQAQAINQIRGDFDAKIEAATNAYIKIMQSDYINRFNSQEYLDSGGVKNQDMMGYIANGLRYRMMDEVKRLAQEAEYRTQDFADTETMERAMERSRFASQEYSETPVDGGGEGLIVENTPVYIDKVFPQAIIKSDQIAVPKGVVNYANLKPKDFEVFIDQLGLRAEPVLKLNGSINKGATKKATTQNIREWFTQEYNGPEEALQGMTNGQIFYELLPLSQRKMFEGNKSSTKIFDSILDAVYVEDAARKLVIQGAPPSGPVEQFKIPWKGGGKEAFESALESDTFVNAMMSEFTKAAANQKYRVDLKQQGAAEQELFKIADGKSDWLASRELTPEREQEYKNAAADINKIKVTDEAGIVAVSDVLKKYNINNSADVRYLLETSLLAKSENIDLAKENLNQISIISENFGLTPVEAIDAFAKSQVTKKGVFKLLNLEGVKVDLETQRKVDLELIKNLIPEGKSFSDLDLQSQRDLLTQIGFGVSEKGAKGLEIYFKQYPGIDYKALGDKRYDALFNAVFKSQGITADAKIGLNESMSLTDFSKTNIVQKPGLRGLGREIKNIMDSDMSNKKKASAIRDILTRPGIDFNETVKANSKLAVSTYKATLDAIKANPKNAKNIIVGWYNTMGLNMQRQPGRQRPYQYVSETIGKGIWSEHFEAYAQTNADMAKVYDAYANGKITYDQAVGIIETRVGGQTMSFIDKSIADKVDLTYTKTGKGTPLGGAVYFNYGKYLDIATGEIVDPSIAAAQITSRLNNKFEGPVDTVLDALVKTNIETRQTVENVRETNAELLSNNEAFAKENTEGLTSAQMISVAENLEALPPVALASRSLSRESDLIISDRTGIKGKISASEAGLRGEKGKRVGILPYTVKDAYGLLRVLARKGKQGEADIEFFDQNLMTPYRQGVAAVKKYRRNVLADNAALRKKYNLQGSIKNKSQLKKKIADTEYTYDHAVRVWVWDKQGMEIPGLSKKQKSLLLRAVNGDKNLAAFATELISITKKDGFVDPGDMWYEGNITSDLLRGVRKNTRPRFLRRFSENFKTIFSKDQLNKLEAYYGSEYVAVLETFYDRAMSGSNLNISVFGKRVKTEKYLRQANARLQEANAITMWFNMSSAVGQLVSTSNYVNMSTNNPVKAAMAFANVPQYKKDVVYLLNSEYMKDRYKNVTIGVTEAEISDALSDSTNKFSAVRSYLLKKGFLPSQIADATAIVLGGATLYRNNYNKYIKDGLSEKEAEAKAMSDFIFQTDKAQQSSDPSRVSAEQATLTGKLFNAFGTVPQQTMRIIDNTLLDILNNRGNQAENYGILAYYGIAQTLGFNYLSNTLWTQLFEEEPTDEEKAKEKATVNQEKIIRTVNGTVGTWMKGFGARGAILSSIKDYILKVYTESGEEKPEYIDAAYELLNAMPSVSAKIRQLKGAGAEIQFSGGFEEALEEEWNVKNPYISAGAKLISFGTNLPTDKAQAKLENIAAAMEEERQYWEAAALLLGYSKYRLGIEEETIFERKRREQEEAAVSRNELLQSMSPDERRVYLYFENIKKQRDQKDRQTEGYLERQKLEAMTPEQLQEYLKQKRKEKGFNTN